MEVNELTKKIYKEYPKVWEKLKDKYHMEKMAENNNTMIFILNNLGIGIKRYDKELGVHLPFSMLYTLIEDFKYLFIEHFRKSDQKE